MICIIIKVWNTFFIYSNGFALWKTKIHHTGFCGLWDQNLNWFQAKFLGKKSYMINTRKHGDTLQVSENDFFLLNNQKIKKETNKQIKNKNKQKQKLFHSLIIIFFQFDLWFAPPTSIRFDYERSLCDLFLAGYHLQFFEFQLLISIFMWNYTQWPFEKVKVMLSTIGNCVNSFLTEEPII